MMIHIKNLGPVCDAQIDLSKKLTVFCGPNNTGKTYVSYVIHALLSQIPWIPYNNQKIITSPSNNKKYIVKIDQNWLLECKKDILSSIKLHLDAIFGISNQKLNSYFSRFQIFFNVEEDEFLTTIKKENFRYETSLEGTDLAVSKQTGSFDVSIEVLGVTGDKVFNLRSKSPNNFIFVNMVLKHLVLFPFTKSEIFPVERNSIYTFSRELSISRNILIEQMQELNSNKGTLSPISLLTRSSKRYPQAIRDALRVADDLNEVQKYDSKYKNLADEIEKELLQGRIIIGKEGEVLYSPDKSSKLKVPIHLSASIVKTLTCLVLYLRHRAGENDLIIIDEPELNLHPDNQIRLARLFARLINNGFRLLISTHSDYIIKELNNLIMLSSIKKEHIQEALSIGKYHDTEIIKPNDVSAYLFNFNSRSNKKVKVEPIEVSDTGFDVKTIDEAIHFLDSNSENLYELLKYAD